ncbi:MAG: hypothetical protein C4583_13850 [Anaerolineaceae bacterium]|nr:MAG: hypothetical protein C4583_13850 [Anaerolineaceae bacterium]
MNRRAIFALGFLVMAAALAYLMRESIERNVIQPLIYFWWVIGIFYDSFPQAVTWIILVAVITMLAVGSFSVEDAHSDGRRVPRKPAQGQVEMLAGWLHRAPDGLYFKWLIAQRLGKLSREMNAFDARQPASSAREAATSPGWDAPEEVAAYLESGLNGSFADYPRPRWPFQRPRPTPLDLDPETAIDFIESKMGKP